MAACRALRRVIGLVVASWIAPLAIAAGPGAPVDRFPRAAAAYAVAVNGRLVWARNLDARRPPASLAKLLAALVILEPGVPSGTTVKISSGAARIAGSRAGLRAGESFRFEDLLTAMLVASANDACIALVEDRAGGAMKFSALMNARARELGMRDSHFVQPCGLDAEGQFTTVRDLLRLSAAAVANPQIADRTAITQAAIVSSAGRRIALHQSNQMVGRVTGVYGLKSGFTSQAGKCLILAAHRDQRDVWIVMLDAPDRWWVALGILEQAFQLSAAEFLSSHSGH
ncbi:MAG: hypothetical protein R3E77_11195 [Steroidobacteraceae bacterium]